MSSVRGWFDRVPLRVRLTLWYILVIGASAVVLGAFLYLELERSLIASVDLSLEAAVAQAASSVENDGGRAHFGNSDDILVIIRGRSDASFAVRLLSAYGGFEDGIGAFNSGPRWPDLAPGVATTGGAHGSWRVMTDPIQLENRRVVGWIQAAESLRLVNDTLAHLRGLYLLAVPLILLLAAAGGIFLVGRLLEPVKRITATARSISATDLTRRIEHRGARDEVSELAETFDRMLDRLQEGFDQERRFTADASHELRTPLTALKGQIDVALSRSRSAEQYREALEELQAQTDRLIRLANDLLYLTRLDANRTSEIVAVNLSDLVSAAVDQYCDLAETRHQKIETSIEAAVQTRGDVNELIRLLTNLLDNAVKYTPDGGTIRVAVTNGAIAKVELSNTGPGIPAADVPRIFERFYRVVDDRSRETGGSGLGLSIAREIVRRHGGSITVASDPGVLTTFTVELPVEPAHR